MAITTFTASTRAKAAEVNANFALCVLTDTSRTISVSHTWTAAQNFDAGTVSLPGIYLEGDTDTGLYQIGANNLGIACNGAKVVDIGTGGVAVTGTGSFSGIVTFTAAPVFSSGTASQTVELDAGKALVTVAITGTGNYVKSASPTLTGTVTAAAITASGAVATGALTVTGAATVSTTLGVTGAVTLSSTLAVGTTPAATGTIRLPNASAISARNAGNTGDRRLIEYNADDYLVLGDAGTHVAIGLFAAASLPAGAANRNGLIDIDTTNNRFVFYSGNARYYVTGTAF